MERCLGTTPQFHHFRLGLIALAEATKSDHYTWDEGVQRVPGSSALLPADLSAVLLLRIYGSVLYLNVANFLLMFAVPRKSEDTQAYCKPCD